VKGELLCWRIECCTSNTTEEERYCLPIWISWEREHYPESKDVFLAISFLSFQPVCGFGKGAVPYIVSFDYPSLVELIDRAQHLSRFEKRVLCLSSKPL